MLAPVMPPVKMAREGLRWVFPFMEDMLQKEETNL